MAGCGWRENHRYVEVSRGRLSAMPQNNKVPVSHFLWRDKLLDVPSVCTNLTQDTEYITLASMRLNWGSFNYLSGCFRTRACGERRYAKRKLAISFTVLRPPRAQSTRVSSSAGGREARSEDEIRLISWRRPVLGEIMDLRLPFAPLRRCLTVIGTKWILRSSWALNSQPHYGKDQLRRPSVSRPLRMFTFCLSRRMQ